MLNPNWLTIIRITGILIMIFSFVVIPDEYPWYYEILLFNLGFLLMVFAKSPKFRQQVTAFFASGS
ncbi:hypothetical protein [Flavilitoribacter nigricans]|uniref:Uncharacterized protein n=1 Tax=Flavilitoribacter nigricans (strain ATCC 23147 / DSM 23189 / NBRC 102662 / NCIMB 1420 / SS-2) TaxID=1122177 RepID=A0A2D0N505_FLAN2|nr:hypothetical protein [Flavilitoribacter nigricans]PHN03470.1 hypothetical protein CRP01_26055 [Flavilitoribacter nigricans DSM 23189 = NBRC 102662]